MTGGSDGESDEDDDVVGHDVTLEFVGAVEALDSGCVTAGNSATTSTAAAAAASSDSLQASDTPTLPLRPHQKFSTEAGAHALLQGGVADGSGVGASSTRAGTDERSAAESWCRAGLAPLPWPCLRASPSTDASLAARADRKSVV